MPGTQELVLTRKPPAELHPSKQKLVKGVLRISLEDGAGSRGEGEGEVAPPAAAASAVGKRAATKGSSIVASSLARAAAHSPSAPSRGNRAHIHKSAAANSRLGSGGGGDTVNTRGSPGGRGGAIAARARKTPAGAGGANSPPGEEAYEEEVGSRVAVGDTIKANEEEEEEQWEGVVWDEDETNEVDSLGAVSASVGTMEVASLHEESSRAGATAPEPQDLLIRVIGIDDIREVKPCRDSLFIGSGGNALHFLPLPHQKRTIKMSSKLTLRYCLL